jgi:thiamine-phosphate pyrophosphorylase
MEAIGERRRKWLERTRLYLICESRPRRADPEQLLRPALQGGVDIVQLRDKDADDKQIVRAARSFRRLCDAYDALFIVNDSPELALACAADGVHVGQEDRGVSEVRRLVGPDLLIGLSTHSVDQFERALATDADYLSVGPVFATPTKPTYEPVGLELVAYAREHADRPFFAIGGIAPDNVEQLAAAGAERVAVVRAVGDAEDPAATAGALREAVAGARA